MPETSPLPAAPRGRAFRLGLPLALLLGLLTIAPAASAQQMLESRLRVDYVLGGTDGNVSDEESGQFVLDVGPTSSPNFIDETVADTSALHDSFLDAYVEPGLIRFDTSTRPASPVYSSSVNIGARYTDELVFVPPLPAFGVSTATALVVYDGVFRFPDAPTASGQLLSSILDLRAVDRNGRILDSLREEASCTAPCPAEIILPGSSAFLFEYTFFWGSPFELSIQVDLQSSVLGFPGDTGNPAAEVLFSDMIKWGGIQEVRDSSGNLVEGWTVESGSGFDYSQPHPIPEPGTAFLLALGLVGLAASGRARRWRDPHTVLRRRPRARRSRAPRSGRVTTRRGG